MTHNEIIAAAFDFGAKGDTKGFAAFADAHRCVVQNTKAKRNEGKVAMMDMMKAYSEGCRQRLAA